MNKEEFFFELPKELIAQTPLYDRTSSKLLKLNKKTGEIIHGVFTDIVELMEKGDCLVLNNTKVIPARLFGEKKGTGGKMEFLLLKRIDDNKWETLVNPGKKAKIGDTFSFGGEMLSATVLDIIEGGNRIVEFEFQGIFEEVLDKLGEMPLPPYITEKLEDKNRYQTVYAKHDGSAAAPTAGLHFTKDILQTLEEKGVIIANVTLHVGLGTFRPVKCENILEHKMHEEYYELLKEDADKINACKANGKKVICVGTTSVRTVETCSDSNGIVKSQKGNTDIFIYPGYKFKVVNSLITNFHLPESTLLMLVSALSTKNDILKAYNEAVENKYRFFSFGDAMFIY